MSSKLRLCFLTPEYALHPPFGGIATYVRDAARWLVSAGHAVDVVCVTRRDLWGKQDDKGVSVHFVPPKRIRPRRVVGWLSRIPGCSALNEAYAGWNLLEDSRGGWSATSRLNHSQPYDVIESVDYGGLASWGLVNPLRRVPLMIRGHGYLDLTLPHVQWTGRHFQHALERFCLQRADFVLTNSEYMAQTYEQEFGVKRDDVAALDLPFLEPAEARSNLDLRSQLGWQAEDPVVAFVGTLELRKGVDLLFQALTRVHKRLPAMKAIFLGQLLKDVEASYHAFMAEAAGWAYHPGAVEAGLVEHYLRQADLLVLPSRFEPLGRVLVEAQAAGIPQIATRAGGMPEVVKDGVTGLLVEPGQPHALAEAILQLCLSPEQRAEMGSKSRQRFLEKYNIDTVMPRQVRVYEALVKGESPAIVLEGTV